MKITVEDVSPIFYRVIELSNVYQSDRNAYDAVVIRSNGVEFLKKRDMRELDSDPIIVNRAHYNTFDYTTQAFLSLNEYRTYLLSKIDEFVKTQTGLHWVIEQKWSSDFDVNIIRTRNVSYNANPYEVASPSMDEIAAVSIKEMPEGKGAFMTQVEKQKFLETEATKIIEKIKDKIEKKA